MIAERLITHERRVAFGLSFSDIRYRCVASALMAGSCGASTYDPEMFTRYEHHSNKFMDNGANLPARSALCNQIIGFASCVKVGFSLEIEGLCSTKAFGFFWTKASF